MNIEILEVGILPDTNQTFHKQPLNLIACVNKQNALGKGGELLYRITHDFEWFKTLTKGHIVVMGYKTFLEIGKPLPERINLVYVDAMRPKPTLPEGIIPVSSLDEIFLIAGFNSHLEIFILGGEKLFKEAFEYGVDTIYRTFVHEEKDGDIHFIPFEKIKASYRLKNVLPDTFEGVNHIDKKHVKYQFEIWEKRLDNQSEKAMEWLYKQKGRVVDELGRNQEET